MVFFDPVWFYGLLVLALTPLIFGFIYRWPVLGVITGAFWMLIFSMVSGLEVQAESQYVDGLTENQTTGWHYEYDYSFDVSTRTGTNNLNGVVNSAYVMYASSGSSLIVGDEINCIGIQMAKSALPTGTATIGTFDGSANPVVTFGTQDVSLLSTAHAWYDYCISEDTAVTLVNGDRVGIKYTGGDAVNTVVLNGDGTNPFDGTVTYRQFWTGAAYTSSTTTDQTFRAYMRTNVTDFETVVLDDPQWVTSVKNEEFTPETRLLLSLISVLMIVCCGVFQLWNPQ